MLHSCQARHVDSQRSVLGRDRIEEPWSAVVGRLVLGSKKFLRKLRQNCLKPVRRRPAWPEIVRAVEQVMGKPWEDFANRRGDFGRDLGLYIARHSAGLTLAALGRETNMHVMAVSVAVKRLGQRLEQDKALRKAKAAAEAILFKV